MLLLVTSVGAGTPATESLRVVLERLSAGGVHLIYSSRQVDGLRVPQADWSSGPADVTQLQAMLAPLGYELRLLPPATWYLVRRRRPDEADAGNARSPATRTLPSVVDAMEEILVTSPRQRVVQDGLYAVSRLDHAALTAYPALGGDVMRAINQLPGQTAVGIGARQYTRGGNHDEVLYRLDGMPLVEPFHLRDFEALFSTVNPAVVDSVDVYPSGFPVSLGSRLAGVVDVTLTTPTDGWEGEAALDMITAGLTTGGRQGDWTWQASARRSTVDLLLDQAGQDYGHPTFNDALGRVTWTGERHALVFGVLSTNDEITLEDHRVGEEAAADFHVLNAWLNWHVDLTPTVALRTRGGVTVVENNRQGELDRPFDAIASLDEERRFDVWSLSTLLTVAGASPWLLKAGLDWQHQQGDFTVDMRASYGPLSFPFRTGVERAWQADIHRAGEIAAAHVAIGRLVDQGLDVEFGVRVDMQDIDPVHDTVVSPRLQINYHPGDRWALNLHAGRYAQFQDLYDIQIDDGLFELAPVQRLDHLNLTLELSPSPHVRADVTAYCRIADSPRPRFQNAYNSLVLLPELHADRVLIAPSRARACGVSAGVRLRIDERLRLDAHVTQARTLEQVDGRWQPRPWDARSQVHLGVQWQSGAWDLSLGGNWHSGFPTTTLQVPGPPPRLDRQRLPDAFTLDLHVARTWDFTQGSVELYLDVMNLTNRRNVAGTLYSLKDDIVVADERHLLPLIPSLGLRLTW